MFARAISLKTLPGLAAKTSGAAPRLVAGNASTNVRIWSAMLLKQNAEQETHTAYPSATDCETVGNLKGARLTDTATTRFVF